jgi:hypothetical protein
VTEFGERTEVETLTAHEHVNRILVIVWPVENSMNVFRKGLISAALIIGGIGVSFADDANVAGEWDLTVETAGGSGTPHLQLKQEGAAVTGTYKSQTLGQAPLSGTVHGHELSLTITFSAQGQTLNVVYSGTVDGASMKGKVSLGELGEGTFTGKRT